MSEQASNSSTGSSTGATTAGALLRQARQAQGMHIAALAAAIKVAPRKLEALESDRFDELPDATFTRALAQTVCRALKIDAAPVLALLPPAGGHRLEQVGNGLNTPFRERPGGGAATTEWSGVLGSPVAWLVGVLVLATLVVYFFPAHWLRLPGQGHADSIASAASGSAMAASAVAGTVTTHVPSVEAGGAASSPPSTMPAPAGAQVAGDAASAPLAAADVKEAPSEVMVASEAAGILQLRPNAQSWIEVTDSRGQTLISRLVEPGEAVGLDGTPPFKLKIGNAGATEVVYHGKPIELAPYIRDNVARFELK
jgi:cytoskeleton protein RodZ